MAPISVSAVDEAHRGFGVALAGGHTFGGDFRDAAQVVSGQQDVPRADIFFEILAALGARDGDDVVALREQPR